MGRFVTMLLLSTTLLIFYKLTEITIPALTRESENISDITDLISAWASVIALLGAVVAYQRWLQNKIRDDSYDFIKKYVMYMCDLEYVVINIFTRLNGLCPQEGLVALTKEEALSALREISDSVADLDQAIRTFHTAKLELEHWDIALSSKGEYLHHETMKGAHDFAITFHTSLNATGNYYANTENKKISDAVRKKLFDNMISEDAKFKQRTFAIREVFNSRRKIKFKKLFAMHE